MFDGFFKDVWGCIKDVSRVLKLCFKGYPRVYQFCFKYDSNVFQSTIKDVPRQIQGYGSIHILRNHIRGGLT